ncbi:MAG: hypothetical protein Q9190_007074 [Brigantiaea leucoxantha]
MNSYGDDDAESRGSLNGSSDNDRDQDADGDGDVEADGFGHGENEEENEDNGEDDDDLDQEDSQDSFVDPRVRAQVKPPHALQAPFLSARPNPISPNGYSMSSAPAPTSHANPTVLLTSPSPTRYSPLTDNSVLKSLQIRPEALTALVYDIVPTIAAPHSTSINSITATPDLRWVFSGGADGYIRKFNWTETANGKSMLTVAQRHPFVDSVTKAGVLLSYWENEDSQGKR